MLAFEKGLEKKKSIQSVDGQNYLKEVEEIGKEIGKEEYNPADYDDILASDKDMVFIQHSIKTRQ